MVRPDEIMKRSEIEELDEAKKMRKAIRGILVDAGIAEHADEGASDLVAKDLLGVFLGEFIPIGKGQKPFAVLLNFRDRIKIGA